MAPHTQPNTRLDQKQSPRRRAQEGAGKKRTTMHHSPAFRNDLSAGHAEGVESKVATWASRLPNCCCSPHGFCIQFSNALPLYQAYGARTSPTSQDAHRFFFIGYVVPVNQRRADGNHFSSTRRRDPQAQDAPPADAQRDARITNAQAW